MQLPSRPSGSFSRPVTRRLGLDDGGSASGWSIVEGSDGHDTAAERVAVLAPTEQILMLAVDLPLPSRRQRQEAVPFAVEDLIADPLDAVHVAVGDEIAPRRYLVAVVRHEIVTGWIAALDAAGLDRAALVPDALLLPLPAAGSWSVEISAQRALIRTDEGVGLALPLSHLPAAWSAAGRPPCVAYGDALPEPVAGAPAAEATADLAPNPAPPIVDLRQGRYALPRTVVPALWRRIATVVAAGVAAHAAIAAANVVALDRIVDRKAAQMRSLLTQVAPGLPVGDDLAGSVADALPSASGSAPSRFLPLLVRISTALAPLRSESSLRALSFDAAAQTLTIEVDAPDIAGLQRVGAALAAGGLVAESGAAAVDEGRATGAFTIRAA